MTTIIVLVVLYVFYLVYTQQKAQHQVNQHLQNKLNKLTVESDTPSQPVALNIEGIDLSAMWSDLKYEEPGLKEVIETFFEPDKINPDQFFANMKLFDGTTYIATLAMEKHIPYEAAKEHMTRQLSASMKHWQPHDLPLGLYTWFIAAYPEVSKWLSEVEEDKYNDYPFTLINDEAAYVNGKCRYDILRKLVDYYSTSVGILECSTVKKRVLKVAKRLPILEDEPELEISTPDPAIKLFKKMFVNGKNYKPYSCPVIDIVEHEQGLKLQFATKELIGVKEFFRVNNIHTNFGNDD